MSNQLPQRSDEIATQDLGVEVVLYHAESGAFHILNGSACVIWRHCDGTKGPRALAELLRQEFVIPAAIEVDEDVAQVLQELADKKLIRFAEEPFVSE